MLPKLVGHANLISLRVANRFALGMAGGLKNHAAHQPQTKLFRQRFGRKRMPAEGIEPTRSCDHWILSPARLPVPPRRQVAQPVQLTAN